MKRAWKMAWKKACKYCCCENKTATVLKACAYAIDREIDVRYGKLIKGIVAVSMFAAIAILGGCASMEPGHINRWDCLISVEEEAPFYGPWYEYDPVLRYAAAE